MKLKDFSPEEHQTWRALFERQSPLRAKQLVPEFVRGLEVLKITAEKIPDLATVNTILQERTGFVGVPAEGFKDPAQFFEMLNDRKFPIGNFIRDARDMNYTPAPDVFHDLYGHLPFFTDQEYADFCHDFGFRALKHRHQAETLKQWDRLFWFTIEFALIDLPEGRRIFGAGIASSFNECAYSLSSEPQIRDFDLARIRDHEFKIDEMQKILYVLKNRQQLFGCLDGFEKLI